MISVVYTFYPLNQLSEQYIFIEGSNQRMNQFDNLMKIWNWIMTAIIKLSWYLIGFMDHLQSSPTCIASSVLIPAPLPISTTFSLSLSFCPSSPFPFCPLLFLNILNPANATEPSSVVPPMTPIDMAAGLLEAVSHFRESVLYYIPVTHSHALVAEFHSAS